MVTLVIEIQMVWGFILGGGGSTEKLLFTILFKKITNLFPCAEVNIIKNKNSSNSHLTAFLEVVAMKLETRSATFILLGELGPVSAARGSS